MACPATISRSASVRLTRRVASSALMAAVLLAAASVALAAVHRSELSSTDQDAAATPHRSLAAATLGAYCRFGGNIMPIDCGSGLKCQPDDSSTAAAAMPASSSAPNLLSRPGSSGAGTPGLTHNPDFATNGTCVPDNSATSAAATTLGTYCRFGGNIMPIDCSPGLKCQPDSSSTAAAAVSASGSPQPRGAGAGSPGLARNPDFATNGTCVPDDSATSAPSPSPSTSPSSTNPISLNPSPSSDPTIPTLGPGPLEKPSKCQYMCAYGQYHGNMPCPKGYTCVLALEGGQELPPESSEPIPEPTAAGSNGSSSPPEALSNTDFVKVTGGILPYEGICAPTHWFGPNVSPDLLSAPNSSGLVISRADTGGSAAMPAAEPAAGGAGSNCSFGGEVAAVMCSPGYACVVETEKRTVNQHLLHGVCVSVDRCDPYLEEKIEDAAGTGNAGTKAVGVGVKLPGLGSHRLWIAVLLFASLVIL